MNKTEDIYPLVSIIALCYNQAEFAIETLDSILRQTYPNIQLLILDDCSTDNSVGIIENWIDQNKAECTFLKSTENLGLTKTLNKGFKYVQGDYLQIVACDDILNNEKIERHVSILQNCGNETALVFSDATLIDENGDILYNMFISYHKQFIRIPSGRIYGDLFTGNFIPAMSILYKRSVFDKIGIWDESLVHEDYDMLLRISRQYRFEFDVTPTVKYRLHENNLHKKIHNWSREHYFIFFKHMDEPMAALKVRQILYDFYKTKNPELITLKKHYFSNMPADTLVLKCIKYGVPLFLFNLIFILNKLLKRHFSR